MSDLDSRAHEAGPLGGTARKVLYAVTAPITAVGFLRGQLAFLVAEGFDVHLACQGDGAVREMALEEGVTFHDVPLTRTWFSLADVRGVLKAARVLRTARPDVLNYSTPKAALVWALACVVGWRPPRVVYLLRGLRLDGEPAWTLRFRLLWMCEVLAARVADTVVCVSPGVRRRALELRIVRADSAIVLGKGSSNGVDTTRFSPSVERRRVMRAELGYADEEIVVGFVGRLTRDKGIYDLLDAVRLLRRPVRVLLVGPTEPDVDLETLWHRYCDLRPRVTHVEYTRNTPSYYAAMDVFVLPSLREGMCNALLEAQAMELPCVTTTVTGCLDAVAPRQTAYVLPAHAPEQLAHAIERLAAAPDLRARMGRAGRQRVLEHFVPEKLWRRYARLYQADLAGLGAEPSPQPQRAVG